MGGSLDVFLPIAGGQIDQALQPLPRLGFWIAQEKELCLTEIGRGTRYISCGKISGLVETAASGTLTVILLFNQVADFVFRVWIASKQIKANRTENDCKQDRKDQDRTLPPGPTGPIGLYRIICFAFHQARFALR